MSNCPSCGGVINRDCFNPTECAQISLQSDEYEIQLLIHKVNILTQAIKDHGIELPELDPNKSTVEFNPDDLPF